MNNTKSEGEGKNNKKGKILAGSLTATRYALKKYFDVYVDNLRKEYCTTNDKILDKISLNNEDFRKFIIRELEKRFENKDKSENIYSQITQPSSTPFDFEDVKLLLDLFNVDIDTFNIEVEVSHSSIIVRYGQVLFDKFEEYEKRYRRETRKMGERRFRKEIEEQLESHLSDLSKQFELEPKRGKSIRNAIHEHDIDFFDKRELHKLLELLGIDREHFNLLANQKNHVCFLNQDKNEAYKWRGVFICKTKENTDGAHLKGYKLIIKPGNMAGWESHPRIQKHKGSPFGDEIITLISGHALVRAGEKDFLLKKPGDYVHFKSNVKHMIQCPLPTGKVEEAQEAVLVVVRFPTEEEERE